MSADAVPGLRPPEIGQDRPDNTQAIVGREGIPVRQDTDGTQIQRLGIAGAEADWGPEQVDITDGEEAIATPENVGRERFGGEGAAKIPVEFGDAAAAAVGVGK